MKRHSVVAGVAAALACSAVNAAVIIIDFDNLPGGGILSRGTDLTNQYASLGVTFETIENGSAAVGVVSDEAYGFWNVTSNIWTNCNLDACGGNRADVLNIYFGAPVSNVSWQTQSFGSSSITFNAYGAGGALLESVMQTGDLVATAFSVGGIARIEALQPFDGWAWGMDDLTFTASSVPEPTALALLGLGLAGLAATRRRKQ